MSLPLEYYKAYSTRAWIRCHKCITLVTYIIAHHIWYNNIGITYIIVHLLQDLVHTKNYYLYWGHIMWHYLPPIPYVVPYLLQSGYIQILLFTAAHSAHRRTENSNSHSTVVTVIYYYDAFKRLSIHPEYSSLINNNVLYNQLLLSLIWVTAQRLFFRRRYQLHFIRR